MKAITLNEVYTFLESKKNSNLVVIVNAYVLDVVYCIDEFDYEIIEEKQGKVLRLISKNGDRQYYNHHGVYIGLDSIKKISSTEDTIYIYMDNQVIKIKI